MVSAIDATKPLTGVLASKADLRANLAAAKAEIEALQGRTVRSVAEFGTVGDNVADDRAAIQAAINATPVGGILLFPRPVTAYKTTAKLVVQRAIRLLAWDGMPITADAGTQAAKIISTSTTEPIIEIDGSAGTSNNIIGRCLQIEGFGFQGGLNGILFNGIVNGDLSYIRDCNFDSIEHSAIRFDAINQRMRFDNINVSGGGANKPSYGIYTEEEINVLNQVWYHCRFSGMGESAIHIVGNSASNLFPLTFYNLTVEACRSAGIHIDTGIVFNVYSGHFEGNGVTDGDPDLSLGGLTGGASALCQVNLHNIYWSSLSAAQTAAGSFRIKFHNSHVRLRMSESQFTSTTKIDGNNKGTSSRIALINNSAVPDISNYDRTNVYVFPEDVFPATTTTTALADITNAINTANKFINKRVLNTTTGANVFSAGSTAASVWRNADGTTAHTPV